MDRLNQTTPRGRPVSSLDAAKANDVLEHFIQAGTLKTILGTYRSMCELLHLKPNVFPLFYPKLKANLNSWKAKALWKKIDSRANHKCYARGKVCPNTRVLIIGAGPCGLRTAIEAQLLGAKVVVIEKRDRMSRNNVLHLWPFVIEDLRALGAKKFFGKFCAGAIDHISIRQLQCVLMKVALLIGVEIYTEVSFERLVEPDSAEKIGWRAEFKPAEHPVSQFEFDVIIGADGKRNTLQGFKRKEFRGKLAIAITANFINKRTEAEARVEEISGVAFIFNQKFFKELNAETGIDLENIVYYKDDTHYFVMTAKKPSLIDKGVIKQDYAETVRLLSPDNVDREALMNYAREAADFSTNYQMPDLEFAVNHYGQPDVAMFDFTSMYAAENASKVIERHGYKLLMILVGDSLLEPFWPTGSGCARGFLSALDACWAIKAWGSGVTTPLEVLAERESIYRLLAQTTPENLNKDCKAYTVDPSTRYPNLNKALLLPQQVLSLYDTDDPSSIELTSRTPHPIATTESHRKRRRRDMHLDPNTLISWIKEQVREYEDLAVEDVTTSFKDGRVLCAILHHYRPDLVDYSAIKTEDVAKNNQLAFDLLEKEIGITPVMTGDDMAAAEVPDYLTMFSYLTQIYDTFRGEIPHIKHPKLNLTPPPRAPKFDPSHQPTIAHGTDNKMFALNPTTIPHLETKPPKSTRRSATSSQNINPKILLLQRNLQQQSLSCKAAEPKSSSKSQQIGFKKANTEPTHTDDAVCEVNCVTTLLNLTPVKSLEEQSERRNCLICDATKRDGGKFVKTIDDIMVNNSVNSKCICIVEDDRIKNIEEWVESVTEITPSKASSNIPKSFELSDKVRYFDANFQEISLQEVDFELDSVSQSDKNQPVAEADDALRAQEYVNTIMETVSSFGSSKSTDGNSVSNIVLRYIEEDCQAVSVQELQFCSGSNTLFIDKPKKHSKMRHMWMNRYKDQVLQNCRRNKQTSKRFDEHVCQLLDVNKFKFLCLNSITSMSTDAGDHIPPELTYDRIVTWLHRSDYKDTVSDFDNDVVDRLTDITSVTRNIVPENETVRKGIELPKIDEKAVNLEQSPKEINTLKHSSKDIIPKQLLNGSIPSRPPKEVIQKRLPKEVIEKQPLKKVIEEKPSQEVVHPVEATQPSIDSMVNLVEKLKSKNIVKFSKVTPWTLPSSKLLVSEPTLSEEKLDLPETKESVKDAHVPQAASIRTNETTCAVISRYTSRPKRHAEPVSLSKPTAASERKTKKRRSFEKYDMGAVEERRKRLEEIAANRADRHNKRRQQRKMQTNQFVKSMQMLQMNGKPDASGPFEDYSLFVYRQTAPHFQDRVKHLEKKFTYVPDRENRLPGQSKGGGADEEFAARIKDLEDKWRDPVPIDKKPKDLLRAIGKIETSDWNIKEIEKKIMENKLGKSVNKEKERVPKWNREQFLARQTKMEKQHLDRQNSAEAKFSEVDKSIKRLEQRLKEGSVRDLGQNKVASITEKLVPKSAELEIKPIPKTNPKPAVVLPTQGGSEYCHFCQKRVYLMERLSAEGRFFHRGCFKCQYCHTTLRLGSYMFDKDGHYGHRFYCSQHFGMPGELYGDRIEKKVVEKLAKENIKPLEKLKIIPLTGVEGVDLLDRVQTPERIEFANLSAGHISSDHDESLSQMDEDEWTDRNFGASTAEVCSSDDEEDSSSLSGSESDNEDAFEEALEEPPTKEGTMRWMERYKQRYSKERRAEDDSDSEDYSSSSDHSSYYENSSGDEEDEPATEGEEDIRARELRKQEVRVEPPVVQTDTGSDTEIVSDESSQESSSKHNSATEISTDSEFAVDEPTPTREIPSIVFNDFNVTKSRGNYGPPKKVQVKSGVLQSPINGKTHKRGIKLEFTPLVPSPVLPKPAPTSMLARTEGYALNRTQSTGGIATKVSLELKKKYLLGDTGVPGSIQKSGSVSTLDSKFKSFHTNISDCQKLLKPAPEISPSMQVFCSKLNERRSPLSPITSQSSPFSDHQPLKSPDIVNPIVTPSAGIIDLTMSPEMIDLTMSPEQPDVTKCTKEASPLNEVKPFEHELEGRPRSPVQEIPIIVPKIDWNQANKTKDSDISSDSLTSDSDSEEHTGIQKSPTIKIFNPIPRVEVHDPPDEIALDSLTTAIPEPRAQSVSDTPKSITGTKKSLNQPKTLPGLQSIVQLHVESHEKPQLSPESEPKYVSGHSTPSDHDSCVEHTTAAMTETELSDWARDGMGSDDFEDVEFELNPDFQSVRKNRQAKGPKGIKKPRQGENIKAHMDEFDDLGHICGKEKQLKDLKNQISLTENLSNILSSIEFMDTGEETSSDEKALMEATMKNNGYVEFQNEDDIAEDSLNPNINNVIEAVSPTIRETFDLENLSSIQKNTGYCIIGNDDNFGGAIVDLKQKDLEKLKRKQKLCENEEDSLLIIETGTTTEENTCSDSTVKNLVKRVSEKEKKDLINVESLINENKTLIAKIREEQKITEPQQANPQQQPQPNPETKPEPDSNNKEYQEHCRRLQSKVEFGNVRDSIDIRKSKRKDKSELPLKPDLIQEESSPVHVALTDLSPKTPKTLYTKEEIKKVRDENQKLVQEMVMNKMKAQNRSLERKKRSRNSFSPSLSPSRPYDLTKSATTDLATQMTNETNKESLEKRTSTYSTSSSVYSTPDVLLSISTNNTPPRKLIPLEKSNTITIIPNHTKLNDTKDSTPLSSSIKQHPRNFTKQLSIHSSFQSKPKIYKNSSLPDTPLTNSEAFSLPDIQQALRGNDFATPKPPPRQKNDQAQLTAEKLKQDARARARLMSNEDLGLSPEDKLRKLREKISKRGKQNENMDVHVQDSIESLVINTERRNSLLYSNDTLTKKRNNSFKRSKSGDDTLHSHTFSSGDLSRKLSLSKQAAYPVRTKSVSEISKAFTDPKLMEVDLNAADKEPVNKLQFCKSDPNLLMDMDRHVKGEKKLKCKDRERRKSITKLISEFFGKKKEGGKSPGGSASSKGFLSRISPKSKSKDKIVEEIARTNSFSEVQHRRSDNVSPPPIPPLPLNYTGCGPSRCTDDSSDGETDWRRRERSSCDTLDQSGIHEGRRVSRSARKAARQAQLKRHRMAQEIQRKLEETEVKTRELEQRGVKVEKALRGESNESPSTRDESDLLKEWFELMRDLTELRRYERELMVRAQELELEDRHARLQQELRERLDNEDHKTKEDVKAESSIINEMMEIVAKRDSLIALLEQDRLRYSEEDRDFEEQMLAKGLRLTPLHKSPEK